MTRLAIALVLALSGPRGSVVPKYVLTVSGDGMKAIHLSVSELEAMPQAKASVRESDGSESVCAGAPVIEVLKRAGLVLNEHPGKAMSAYVSVRSMDRYQVVFGLGELVPAISGRSIFLATRVNGKPLGANVGPVRLVVDGDKMQARSARMVTELKLVQLRK